MRNNLQDLISEHKLELFCGVVAFGVLVANLGSIKGFMDSSNQLRDSLKTEQADNQRLQTEQLVSEQRKEVADERYRSNCTMLFSLNENGYYTTLSEGDPVLKGELAPKYRGKSLNFAKMPKNSFLPAGMTVCDAYGNTAKLVKDPNLYGIAVVRDIANTGDQALIKRAMERERGIRAKPVK